VRRPTLFFIAMGAYVIYVLLALVVTVLLLYATWHFVAKYW
jgi:heme exporter protein D